MNLYVLLKVLVVSKYFFYFCKQFTLNETLNEGMPSVGAPLAIFMHVAVSNGYSHSNI